jgi:hypothetical protein
MATLVPKLSFGTRVAITGKRYGRKEIGDRIDMAIVENKQVRQY